MNTLSAKSRKILGLIADGYSYAQIVDGNSGFTYPDIFNAANEALALLSIKSEHNERIAAIQASFPKAYSPWTETDDRLLLELHENGIEVKELSERFQRQPSAIRARLTKLGIQ